METFLQISGLAHLGLATGSLLIPKLLHWKKALENVPILISQMFWTYAGYILGINIFFGLISLAYPGELISGSPLAIAFCSLVSAYWFTRIIIQFTYFDKSEIPDKWFYTLGEWALNLLFVFFVILYGYATYYNINL